MQRIKDVPLPKVYKSSKKIPWVNVYKTTRGQPYPSTRCVQTAALQNCSMLGGTPLILLRQDRGITVLTREFLLARAGRCKASNDWDWAAGIVTAQLAAMERWMARRRWGGKCPHLCWYYLEPRTITCSNSNIRLRLFPSPSPPLL